MSVLVFSVSTSTSILTVLVAISPVLFLLLVLLIFLLLLFLAVLVFAASTFFSELGIFLRLLGLLLLFFEMRGCVSDAELLLLFKDDLPIIIYRAYIDQSILLCHSSYLSTYPLQTVLAAGFDLVKSLKLSHQLLNTFEVGLDQNPPRYCGHGYLQLQ